MTSLEERFATLEAVVNSQRAALDEQQAEIARLDARLSPATQRHRHTAPTTAIDGGDLSNGMSRRTWLTGGAVAAGAAVVGATVAPRSVAAADAGNMIIGGDNVSEGGNTRLNGTGTAPYVGQNVLTVSDQNSSSSFPSAIGAYGEGDRVRNGLYAFTVTALDSRGDRRPFTQGTVGRVEGLEIVEGEVILSIGALQVPLNQVTAVQIPQDPA